MKEIIKGTVQFNISFLYRKNMFLSLSFCFLSFSQLSLMTKRSEILRMDKAVAKEEGRQQKLEKIIERDNLNFEELLRQNEKKTVEARTL